MKFTEKLFSLLTKIFSYLSQKVEKKSEEAVEVTEELAEESEIIIQDDKVNVARRTLITKLSEALPQTSPQIASVLV